MSDSTHSSSLCYLILMILFGTYTTDTDAVTIVLANDCPSTIWPASLSGDGPTLIDGGVELLAGHILNVEAPIGWSGRFWARTGCTFDGSGTGPCATGGCENFLRCHVGGTPPATLAEFTLKEKQFYDVSIVDGFNVPVSIYTKGGSGDCKNVECFKDLNKDCPKDFQVVVNGMVVACKSACLAMNSPEYCCTGSYNSPSTCGPSSYSQRFKAQCPSYYTYAYDDTTSLFTCTGANYLIKFC